MRAAYFEATGDSEVIKVGELPEPEPGPGQVRVRVKAVALNPINLYIRSGMVAMPLPKPYIIASDLAGTVEKVGPNVKRFKVGDRVWGSNQGLVGRQGVASELAAVDEEWLYATPDTISDEQAAAMALTGITAHLGLFWRGQLRPGELVYVPGGSGGVGSMVVQMARAAGAKVATSAGSPERVAACAAAGASLALNYKTDDIPSRLKEFAPEGLDLWYETQREPDFDVLLPLLRKNARVIVIAGRSSRPVLPLGPFYTRNASILGFAMFLVGADDQRKCAEDMNRWAAEGKLKSVIGRRFPLAEAAAADKFLDDNTTHGAGTLTGKVVITID